MAGTGARRCRSRASTGRPPISLDVFLPDMLGWTVLESAQAQPARRATSRCRSSRSRTSASTGWSAAPSRSSPRRSPPRSLDAALDRLKSFTAARLRRLLVVEDDAAERMSVGAARVTTMSRSPPPPTGAEALELMRGSELRLRRARPAPARHVRLRAARARSRRMPRCATCPSSSSPDASSRCRRSRAAQQAKSIVLKGVRSPERLLDETALFLHRVVADLPAAKQAHDRSRCTRATRRCAAARCSSSTMTSATSSR